LTPLLSIVIGHFNAPVWAELCIKSIRRFTTVDYELIVIDDHSEPDQAAWLFDQKDIRLVVNPEREFHGGVMDKGVQLARGEFVCHVDVDSHFQRAGWERDVFDLYRKDPLTRLVCKGGPISIGKPVHPPIFFHERKFFVDNGLSFKYQKGVEGSTDTAQKTYWDILKLGYKVELFSKGPTLYVGSGGDEIYLGGKPTIYHHHYGTHLKRIGTDQWKWDGWKRPDDYIKHQEDRTVSLFKEPLVNSIMKDASI
jgi:glycosyltransferase involved in cell wall biosynthesis